MEKEEFSICKRISIVDYLLASYGKVDHTGTDIILTVK